MIIAQIASLPDREESLKLTIESLIDQVDHIYVGLNNYEKIPTFCKTNKIEAEILDNSKGDAAKFNHIEDRDGYILTCDDDLIYPPDYVLTMLKRLAKYGCIVTAHGRCYDFKPILNYYKSATRQYRCLYNVDHDIRVDVGGTGVMCFHTDIIKLRYSDFLFPNMADVWVAKAAYHQNVRIICVAHKQGWIQYIKPIRTIFNDLHYNCLLQTEIINSML